VGIASHRRMLRQVGIYAGLAPFLLIVAGGIVRIVLPLSLPGIATTAIFAFTLSMQEYLYAVVFSSPVDQKVVTVGLPTMLIRGDIYFWGSLMAGSLLVGLPAALAFNFVLDRFIQGLTGVSDQ